MGRLVGKDLDYSTWYSHWLFGETWILLDLGHTLPTNVARWSDWTNATLVPILPKVQYPVFTFVRLGNRKKNRVLLNFTKTDFEMVYFIEGAI